MTPKDFKKKYLPFALETQNKTGIDALVTLAQSALETGWGEHAPQNMMFGVKDTDGVNGNEQLVTTFEYSSNPNLTPKQIGLNSIKSIKLDATQSKKAGRPMYKYIGDAYFRAYETPEQSFTDHAMIFLTVKKYASAMAVKNDPEKFIQAIAPIYAQAPTYADTVIKIYRMLKNV